MHPRQLHLNSDYDIGLQPPVIAEHMWADSHLGGRVCRRFLRGAAAAGLAASIALAVAACTGSAAPTGTANGTALAGGPSTYAGLSPLKPGTQLGLLFVTLKNRSRSPIAISSVTLIGPAVGTVISVVDVKIAPAKTENNAPLSVEYQVSPPAEWSIPTASCTKQPLVRLPGFRLAPRALVQVWIIIQAARPGPFHVKAHLVHYRQHGISYRQLIPIGYEGYVIRNWPVKPIDKLQARCMKSEHARPLKGQHLHKPKNYN